MKSRKFIFPLVKKTLLIELSLLPLLLMAEEPPAGFVEEPAGIVEFDHAETFVPPEQLPIVESKGLKVLNLEKEADKSRAVAVTPDGQVYTSDISAKDLEIFSNALEQWSGSFEGIHSGPVEQREIDSFLENSARPDDGEDDNLAQTESVIFPDERVQINDTTQYP